MEQVGSSGLPPLLPSVPVAVPVADPDQAVQQDLGSLTELVPVRSKQPTTATDRILASDVEIPSDISNPHEVVIHVGTENADEVVISDLEAATEVLSNCDSLPSDTGESTSRAPEPNNISVPSEKVATPVTPAFNVPPHLLGRTVDNPTADIPPGRRMQKPRLGVRVPYRNLTSQIVTQNEIAQELFERSLKKNPSIADNIPGNKGIKNTEMFARKLTQRLANSLSTQTPKGKTAPVPDTIGALKALLPNKNTAVSDGVRLSPGFTHSEKEQSMGNEELLAILEGDGESVWLPDKVARKVEGSSASSSLHGSNATVGSSLDSPPKLDPVLEKELALKQLMELPIKFPSKKPEKKEKAEKAPAQRKRKSTQKEKVDFLEIPKLEPYFESGTVTVVNGVENENASPNMPTNKPPSRKRKITPEVAAVLKKGRVSKKSKEPAVPEPIEQPPEAAPEAVANGRGRGRKPGRKKANKKTSPAKPEPEAVVTNGSTTAANKRGPKRKETKVKTPPAKKVIAAKPLPVVTKTPKTPKTARVQLRNQRAIIVDETEEDVDDPEAVEEEQEEEEVESEEIEEEEDDEEEEEDEEEIEEEEEEEQLMEVDVPNSRALPEVQEPIEEPTTPSQSAKKNSKVARELEQLLGDEGAVNMLYSVEGHTSKVSSRDLARRTRLVKTAVMRLSTGPQGHVPLALRARRSLNATEPPKLTKMARRKRLHSSGSHESLRTPPYLTPVDTVNAHTYNARQKLTADASRIIRRHSSSSTFSSPSVSPRRQSVEENKDDPSSAASTSRKRGVPIFIRDTHKNQTYNAKKKPKVVNPVAFTLESARQLLELGQPEKPTLLPNPAALRKKELKKISSEVKNKVKSEMMKNFKKGIDSAAVLIAKKAAKLERARLLAEKRAAEELAKARKVAEELLAAQQEMDELELARAEEEGEAGEGNSATQQIPRAHIKKEGAKNSASISPDASSETCKCCYGACVSDCAVCVTGPLFCVSPTGYSNLLRSLNVDQRNRRGEERERQRSTARSCAGTFNYKEITVRRYDNMVQLVMSPVSTKMRCALNVQVLRELRDALQQVRKDDTCRVVLVTSSGSAFCQGVDVSCLVHNNVDKRKTAAIDLTLALKDFLKCVAHYPKPLIAGVNGAAVGLGVTMLPLFDMVFASDKATFHTPYAQLGQVPEGGATLTLPHMLGHNATSELLLNCRKLTAKEALQCGLVTRILWPDKFLEELIPAVKVIASQSAQSMEATKALLRHGLRTKFDAALESESHLLVTHWTSQECQTQFRRWLDEESVVVQRQTS